MTMVAIPEWAAEGFLPPVDELNPISESRSPYRVSLADVVMRFCTSEERRRILDGLLRYRSALQAAGLTEGFQWIDGSFLEDIETFEARPPNDIDVVTFYRLPQGVTQRAVLAAAPNLFNHDAVKAEFHVDAYRQSLSVRGEPLARKCVYWYSIWSHRRSYAWKGYLEITLDPAEDTAVRAQLTASTRAGDKP